MAREEAALTRYAASGHDLRKKLQLDFLKLEAMKAGPMLNRRKQVRAEVFKKARVLVGWHDVLDCRITNLSPAGACLRIASSIDLPSELDLIADRSEASHSCRVVWRLDDQAGVSLQPSTK